MGNTRVTFDTQTGSATSLQTDNYYPFGMEINVNTTSPKNEYLYNKKELQEELTEYDYGARFYDPVIARWTVIDPLAEKSRRWSTYNYVEDDPIRMTDPDGMVPTMDQNGMTHPDPNGDPKLAQRGRGKKKAKNGPNATVLKVFSTQLEKLAHPWMDGGKMAIKGAVGLFGVATDLMGGENSQRALSKIRR